MHYKGAPKRQEEKEEEEEESKGSKVITFSATCSFFL